MEIKVLWHKNEKIALALSGGVDSIVLFHLLTTTYKDSYKELVVFHINHGLRVESTEEELFVRKLTNEKNIKIHIAQLDLQNKNRPSHISEEMLARKLRYEHFEKFAKLENITTILTAHHKNDCVENILFRLLTGRGTNSTLSIEERAIINNLTVLRPCLNNLKEDIIDFAKKKNLTYYDDISNFNTDYSRNYIRHEIVPLLNTVNNASLDNLVNFANNYKELNEFFSFKLKETIKSLDCIITVDKIKINFAKFLKLSPLEKSRLVEHFILENFQIFDVSKKAISTIVTHLNEFSGNVSFDLKDNLKIIKEYQTLTICKFEKKCYNDKIEITKENLTEDFNCNFNNHNFIITTDKEAAEIGVYNSDLPLSITNRKNGDTLKRGNITKKISRLFIDEKIPKSLRDSLPIVRNNSGEILGVLGINSKVNNKTNFDYYIKLLKG